VKLSIRIWRLPFYGTRNRP